VTSCLIRLYQAEHTSVLKVTIQPKTITKEISTLSKFSSDRSSWVSSISASYSGTKILHGFAQSLQMNARIIPQISQILIPSRSSPIHYSLIILLSEAT
jgi:hypothetical protein